MYGLYVYLIIDNSEYRASSLGIKTLDKSQTWVNCKRRPESYFEQFWSTVLQRTSLQFYGVIFVQLNVNSLKFRNLWKVSFDSNDQSIHASRDTKLC